MVRTIFLVLVAILALALGGAWLIINSGGSDRTVSAKPHLLLVIVDDQRTGTMKVVPAVVDNFPIVFNKAFTTTPNCCPSRAAILTGEYAHKNGVTRNGYLRIWKQREADSLGPWLQENGYYTGYVGKYFNGFSSTDPAPPGWDEFYGRTYDTGDGIRSIGLKERRRDDAGILAEKLVEYPNSDHPDFYPTRLFAEIASDFVDRANDSRFNPEGRPFALVIAPTAPNMGHTRASFESKYADAPLPEWSKPSSFLEKHMKDKPAEVRNSRWTMNDPSWHREIRASQMRTLMSVNDLVERVWRRIDAHGLRPDTWGLYFSDNGRMWGEHRLRRKYFAYEESVGVPMRIAAPGVEPQVVNQLVAGIDISPTLTALAGDVSRHDFDGRSLLPLLEDRETSWRDALLLENASLGVHYNAIRTKRWKYIRWVPSGNEELYDLRNDPHELRNLSRKRDRIIETLSSRLQRILADPE